jgi:hypothetical protein
LRSHLLSPPFPETFMADNEEQTVSKDGYELTFYPGFASRCTVRRADGGEVELYRQEQPYRLPGGQTRPRTRHLLRLVGGEQGQNVTLDIDDPEHRIARITIELYDQNHQPGAGRGDPTSEMLTVDQDSITCPPDCL